MTPLRLVPLGSEHRAVLLETMRDAEILRFTRTPQPMPEGWLDDWLAEFDQAHRHGWAVLGRDAEFLGYAVTGVVDHVGLEVELGYAVAPDARGRGVATETLRLLTQWAFDRGLVRVTALISTDNPASSRVAEKVGYTFEGCSAPCTTSTASAATCSRGRSCPESCSESCPGRTADLLGSCHARPPLGTLRARFPVAPTTRACAPPTRTATWCRTSSARRTPRGGSRARSSTSAPTGPMRPRPWASCRHWWTTWSPTLPRPRRPWWSRTGTRQPC